MEIYLIGQLALCSLNILTRPLPIAANTVSFTKQILMEKRKLKALNV